MPAFLHCPKETCVRRPLWPSSEPTELWLPLPLLFTSLSTVRTTWRSYSSKCALGMLLHEKNLWNPELPMDGLSLSGNYERCRCAKRAHTAWGFISCTLIFFSPIEPSWSGSRLLLRICAAYCFSLTSCLPMTLRMFCISSNSSAISAACAHFNFSFAFGFLDAAFLNLLQRKVRYNYTLKPGLKTLAIITYDKETFKLAQWFLMSTLNPEVVFYKWEHFI